MVPFFDTCFVITRKNAFVASASCIVAAFNNYLRVFLTTGLDLLEPRNCILFTLRIQGASTASDIYKGCNIYL